MRARGRAQGPLVFEVPADTDAQSRETWAGVSYGQKAATEAGPGIGRRREGGETGERIRGWRTTRR